jgi:hypothetical protein
MKKLMFVVLALCMLAPLAYSAPKTINSAPKTIKGTIIDNMCAESHKADMATFIKTHPKSCAIAPNCMASGYSIYFSGQLMKFNDASNKKIADFLKISDSKLTVDVEVNKVKGLLDLVSIKNSK